MVVLKGGGTLATVDIVIVVGFLVIVTVIGYVMSRVASRGMDDYFLGGNKIPWWVLGISTSTSNFDMAGTMVIVAMVFALGMKGFLVEIRGGVGLSLAFLMVFLGKWLRRSRVMTSAEWMRIRFGTDRQGNTAHLLSAIAQIVLAIGMITYFAKGAGAFLVHFIPLSEFWCTTIMVAVGLFYTLLSGLYGVVFTDVVQMILLTFTAIYVSVHAFSMRDNITLPDHFMSLDLANPEGVDMSLFGDSAASWEAILSMFGICVFMWVARTMLEGCGGVGGYTDQRFFAARNEREASLLTLESIILSLFRWTMVAGLVVMGYSILQADGAGAALIRENTENVLPVVLGELLPTGIKGLVIAGLVAAAMSTFDSTLNAGASYIVKDVYQGYIKPEATGEQLMSVSKWATTALCVAGVGLAVLVDNINDIWNLITMGLGAGFFVPTFLRWYWPRFTGYGFAIGTGTGLVAALVVNSGLGWPLYYSFPTIVGIAFVGCILGSLLTKPTNEKQLIDFFVMINPWGLWGAYARKARETGVLTAEESSERLWEKLYDAIAICFAVPFQMSLLLAGMAFIFHDWGKFAGFGITAAVCSVGLYFFWFKNLKSVARCEEEDEYYAAQRKGPAAGENAGAPHH